MAYLGLQPLTQSLATSQQFFSGDGVTQQFNLQQSVGRASDLVVTVNGNPSVPTTNYTASGGALVFTSPPSAGVNNISVTFLAGALNTINLTANVFVLGTNVAPSISGLGATTTGIYWPTTSSLGIVTSGQQAVLFSSTLAATSTSTGALQVKGGIGVSGAAYVGGVVYATSGTTSTGTTSGALVVTGGIGATGSMNLGGSMTISGGLTVAGSFNTTSTNSLVVNTPFLFLANTNVTNAVDIGVVGQYENSDLIVRYSGLYRTAADNRWRLFSNLITQPGTTITTNDGSYVYADLWLGNANITAITTSTNSLTGALVVGGGVGIGGALYTAGNINATTWLIATSGINSTGNILAATVTGGSGTFNTGLTLGGTLSSTGYVNTTSNISAAIANFGSIGTVGAITSTGLINTSANVSCANLQTFGGFISGLSALAPTGNGIVNLGSTSNWWSTIFGVAINAHYADLAENYVADTIYAPGTVVAFGGTAEVTESIVDMDPRVAGIISTNPAYLMNGGLAGPNVVAVALTGRVPTKVRGPIAKGDMMVSAGEGYARAEKLPQIGTVIGKALEDFNGDHGVIEVVVGRN